MNVFRAVALVAVATLLIACSTNDNPVNSPPSSSPPSSVRSYERAPAPSGCAELADAYEAWASAALDTYFDPADLRHLLDNGAAFAEQVLAVEDVPVLELAGSITTYTEEVELLLTAHENGEGPSTFEAELARDGIVEQVRAIARTVCR